MPSVIGETGPAPYRHGVSLVGIESSTDRLSLQAMQRSAWRERRGMVGNIQCRERQTKNHRGLDKAERGGEREHHCECEFAAS